MASKSTGDEDLKQQDTGDGVAPLNTAPLNIPSLARRAYDATITSRHFAPSSNPLPALSHCPWTLRSVSSKNGSKTESKDPYPSFTYLDLRRQQNESWATSRLEEGVELAKSGKSKEAEACYMEGLNLVPSHTELMVAYGALCANLGRTTEGIARLERALELDPAAANAEQYLTIIRQEQRNREQQKQRHPNRDKTTTLALRSDKALQDAMAESVIAGSRASVLDDKYPLLTNDDDDDDSKDERRRRHRKKSKKKKKRKKKRRRYDSDTSDSDSSRRRSKKKRKKRHNRSPDTSDSDESTTRETRRRHDSS